MSFWDWVLVTWVLGVIAATAAITMDLREHGENWPDLKIGKAFGLVVAICFPVIQWVAVIAVLAEMFFESESTVRQTWQRVRATFTLIFYVLFKREQLRKGK